MGKTPQIARKRLYWAVLGEVLAQIEKITSTSIIGVSLTIVFVVGSWYIVGIDILVLER